MGEWTSLMSRARETRLARWVVAYAGSAAVAAGVLEAVSGPWGLTDLTVQRVHVALLLGLPTAAVLAWYHGKQGRQAATLAEAALLLGLWVPGGGFIVGMHDGPSLRRVPGWVHDGPSIAVLPFQHQGPSEARAYVTEAIHETVTNALAEVSELVVISRTSVLNLPAGLELDEIADALAVDHVLGGSVRWAASEFRLSLELTDIGTRRSLWTESFPGRYDRPEELYELPAHIVRQVARGIHVTVAPDEARRVAVVASENPTAVDLYVRAQAKGFSGRSALREGVALLEAAVEADPGFAGAWGLLAHRRYRLSDWEAGDSALARADALDPETREALLAHAYRAYEVEQDYVRAVARLEEIVAARPNFAAAVIHLAGALRRVGDWDRAVTMYEQALDLDPRRPYITALLSEVHFMMGNFETSLTVADRVDALSDGESSWGPRNRLRTLMWGMGDTVATRLELERTPPGADSIFWGAIVAGARGDHALELELFSRDPGFVLERALSFYAAGDTAAARLRADSVRIEDETRLAECPEWGFCRDGTHAPLGWAYAILGDHDEAERHLNRSAVELRPSSKDAYIGPAREARRAYGYAFMGRWEDATRAFADLLGRPTFHHAAWLRVNPLLDRLRDEHPPFMALLDRHDPPEPEGLERP